MCRAWSSKFIVAIPKVVASVIKLQSQCKHMIFVQNENKGTSHVFFMTEMDNVLLHRVTSLDTKYDHNQNAASI